MAGLPPVLAQRAVEDSPRWTRAVGGRPRHPANWEHTGNLVGRCEKKRRGLLGAHLGATRDALSHWEGSKEVDNSEKRGRCKDE